MISSDAVVASEHAATDPWIPANSTILPPPSKEGVGNFQCPQVGIIECPLTVQQMGKQLSIVDVGGRGDSRQGQPVGIDSDVVLGTRLAAIGRVRPDEITAPFGANAATVHDDVARSADHVRSAPDHLDQAGMDLVQYTGRRPRCQTAAQGGPGNTTRSSPKFAPLHPLTQEKTEGGNDVCGGCWRMTEALRRRQDLVNQAGNQINRRNQRAPSTA
jgi:hypothetical protein